MEGFDGISGVEVFTQGFGQVEESQVTGSLFLKSVNESRIRFFLFSHQRLESIQTGFEIGLEFNLAECPVKDARVLGTHIMADVTL